MNRWIVVIIAFLIVVLALLLVPDLNAENARNPEDSTDDGLQFEVPERMLIKGVFVGEKSEMQPERVGSMRSWAEPELKSGMPCDRYEEVMHEQATGEEADVRDEILVQESIADMEGPQTTRPETVENTCELVTEESVLVLPSTTAEPIPEVTEAPAQPDLHEYLMAVLTEHNIQHWYSYACCQIQQESGWNPYAENKNGLDKGLLQYRITYYPGANIFDPYEQIRIYVGQVKARIDAGLSIEEIISRHMTSDYVPEVNWKYVNDVMRWLK